jgi:hypothetical protein
MDIMDIRECQGNHASRKSWPLRTLHMIITDISKNMDIMNTVIIMDIIKKWSSWNHGHHGHKRHHGHHEIQWHHGNHGHYGHKKHHGYCGHRCSEPTIDITNITDYPVIKAVIVATDIAVTMGSSFTVRAGSGTFCKTESEMNNAISTTLRLDKETEARVFCLKDFS